MKNYIEGAEKVKVFACIFCRNLQIYDMCTKYQRLSGKPSGDKYKWKNFVDNVDNLVYKLFLLKKCLF